MILVKMLNAWLNTLLLLKTHSNSNKTKEEQAFNKLCFEI